MLELPKDPSEWLSRPLGYWERQLLTEFPRCSISSVSQLESTELCPEQWENCVHNLVETEPNLRADISLSELPSWVPATDFTQIFSYRDCSHQGYSSLEDVWHLVEEESNTPWDYGSGRPLFRNVLMKIVGGYVVINTYHHAAGDGTSGMIILNSILSNYDILQQGGSLESKPNKPLPSIEDLTASVEKDPVLQTLLEEKLHRARTYRPVLPFDMEEMEANCERKIPINKSMIRSGSSENYQAIRSRCREEEVTVGSLALASVYLTMAVLKAQIEGQDIQEYEGSEQLIDVPVNMRRRLKDTDLGNTHCAFLITEITTKATVRADTKLWEFAKEVGQQVKERLQQEQHLVFSKAKKQFETSPETSELAASTDSHQILDVLVSNMMSYPGTLSYPWATLKSVHCVGSVWAPGFANYLLLFQATESFNYDVVFCPGSNNEDTARKLLDVFVRVMEESHQQDKDFGFQEIFQILQSLG